MSEPVYAEPTRRARVLALLLFAGGLSFAFALHLAWPLLMAHIRGLPVCEQTRWFGALVGVQALLMAVIPAAMLAIGLRVRRSARWPAPGMPVLRRTRVLEGAPALRRAHGLLGGAAVLGLVFAALVWRLYALIHDIAERWQCIAS